MLTTTTSLAGLWWLLLRQRKNKRCWHKSRSGWCSFHRLTYWTAGCWLSLVAFSWPFNIRDADPYPVGSRHFYLIRIRSDPDISTWSVSGRIRTFLPDLELDSTLQKVKKVQANSIIYSNLSGEYLPETLMLLWYQSYLLYFVYFSVC